MSHPEAVSVVERPSHLTVRLHNVRSLYIVLKAGDSFVAVLTGNLKFDSRPSDNTTLNNKRQTKILFRYNTVT